MRKSLELGVVYLFLGVIVGYLITFGMTLVVLKKVQNVDKLEYVQGEIVEIRETGRRTSWANLTLRAPDRYITHFQVQFKSKEGYYIGQKMNFFKLPGYRVGYLDRDFPWRSFAFTLFIFIMSTISLISLFIISDQKNQPPRRNNRRRN